MHPIPRNSEVWNDPEAHPQEVHGLPSVNKAASHIHKGWQGGTQTVASCSVSLQVIFLYLIPIFPAEIHLQVCGVHGCTFYKFAYRQNSSPHQGSPLLPNTTFSYFCLHTVCQNRPHSELVCSDLWKAPSMTICLNCYIALLYTQGFSAWWRLLKQKRFYFCTCLE